MQQRTVKTWGATNYNAAATLFFSFFSGQLTPGVPNPSCRFVSVTWMSRLQVRQWVSAQVCKVTWLQDTLAKVEARHRAVMKWHEWRAKFWLKVPKRITYTDHICANWHRGVNEAAWWLHTKTLSSARRDPLCLNPAAPDINTRLVSGEVLLYVRARLLLAYCAKTSTPGGPVSPYLKGCLHSASVASSVAAAFKHARKTTHDISPSRRTLQMRRRQLRDSRQMQSC